MMVITPQAVFMYLGIAAILVAAVMLGLAAYTFFHEDIRGVMDDLSGRRRANAVGRGRAGRRARTAARRPHVAQRPAPEGAAASVGPGRQQAASAGEPVQAAGIGQGVPAASDTMRHAMPAQPDTMAASRPMGDDEDTAETIVDEDLGITRRPVGVDFGLSVEEDDVLTEVASLDEASAQDVDTVATEPVPATGSPLFRVTRRIVSISSPEVIGER